MSTFLFEVGTEELPADFIESAIQQWETLIPKRLADVFLTPEKVEVYGTPRRLAVIISGLPQQQRDRTEEIKGPPAQIAFKAGGPRVGKQGRKAAPKRSKAGLM